MARSSEPARAALVAHAERLFAERGIEAVSLRDVSAAAGQRNHSAAQYHFTDRHGLVAAVYEARMGEVNARRHERLAQLARDGRDDDLAALVEAAIVPLVEVIAEADGWYGRFLARTRWDTLAREAIVNLPAAESIRTVMRLITAQLDELPAAAALSRADQLLTLIIGTVAGWEWARHRGTARLSQEALTDDLIVTAVALLRAPAASPRPTSELRSSDPRSTDLTGLLA